MANKFYPKGAEKVLNGAVNFSTANISVALVANAYTYSDAHEYLSDLGATVGTAQPLASKVTTGGVFDADDVTFTAVSAGDTIEAVVLYKDTGVAGTSPLIAYIDTITGFPLATNGGDITISWDTGSNKIFKL